MEVGHWVIALIPVHVDHDPVERADTRHGVTIADSSIARRIHDFTAARVQALRALYRAAAAGCLPWPTPAIKARASAS
jgi:hypothetical protein